MATAKKKTQTVRTTTKKTAAKPASDDIRALSKQMRGIDLCMMSTWTKGGAIRTRPMSNNGEVDFEGEAWFFSWKDSEKVRDLKKNSAVALGYTGGTKTKPVWIAVEGTGRVVTDVAKKNALWLEELERWFGDAGPEDPRVVLVHVKAVRAAFWSYGGEGEVSFQ